MSIVLGQDIYLPFFINETDTLAGTSAELVSPVKGFVRKIITTVQKDVGTGGTVKVAVGTTDVAGASVTVANAATKGTIQSADATAGSATREVAENGRLQVIPDAAFATTGAVSGFVVVNTAH